jgi:hypothetical protein
VLLADDFHDRAGGEGRRHGRKAVFSRFGGLTHREKWKTRCGEARDKTLFKIDDFWPKNAKKQGILPQKGAIFGGLQLRTR